MPCKLFTLISAIRHSAATAVSDYITDFTNPLTTSPSLSVLATSLSQLPPRRRTGLHYTQHDKSIKTLLDSAPSAPLSPGLPRISSFNASLDISSLSPAPSTGDATIVRQRKLHNRLQRGHHTLNSCQSGVVILQKHENLRPPTHSNAAVFNILIAKNRRRRCPMASPAVNISTPPPAYLPQLCAVLFTTQVTGQTIHVG